MKLLQQYRVACPLFARRENSAQADGLARARTPGAVRLPCCQVEVLLMHKTDVKIRFSLFLFLKMYKNLLYYTCLIDFQNFIFRILYKYELINFIMRF